MTHTLSLRISPLIWRDTQRYAELLEILPAACPAITEVAFFTGFTHPPRPLAEIQDTARRLKDEIIPAARALGLHAGINHLSTLGHLDENAFRRKAPISPIPQATLVLGKPCCSPKPIYKWIRCKRRF